MKMLRKEKYFSKMNAQFSLDAPQLRYFKYTIFIVVQVYDC